MSLLKIINENEPCGIDFKYDDKYIFIELEIEKNFNASNTGKTQWDILVVKCEDVLTNHSKDLKILSYWLYAQWQLNGWSKFLNALEQYVDILQHYNKMLFPLLDKRKIKILEWVDTVLGDILLEKIDGLDKKELVQFHDILNNLTQTLLILTDLSYDLFKPIRIKCNTAIQSITRKEEETAKQLALEEEEKKKKEEEHAALSKVEQLRREEESEVLSKFSSQISQHNIVNLKLLDNSDIDTISKVLLPLSKNVLKDSPADFIGYKLLFSLAEIYFEEVFRDSTIIVDDFLPSDDIIHAVRPLEEESAGLPQLEALIEQLVLRPTWIEGYYITSKILYKLSQVENAIKVENMLLNFLLREDKIMQMYIRNQSLVPKNIETWMQTKLISLNTNNDTDIEYQQTYQEILKIKQEENIQNALIHLEEHYQKAQGEESRFRWRLLMVDFALEIGDKKLALSLLYQLEKLIEKFKIDYWQPSLAITIYEMLSKPIFAQELSSDAKERIYSKLSILDIQKVIKY